MTLEEMKSAYEFGKEIVVEATAEKEEVPKRVYDRLIELMDLMINEYERRLGFNE